MRGCGAQCKEKPQGDKYGFTHFARSLNDGKGLAPLPSDSRRRPDRAALEVLPSSPFNNNFLAHNQTSSSVLSDRMPSENLCFDILPFQSQLDQLYYIPLLSCVLFCFCTTYRCLKSARWMQWGDMGTAGAEKYNLEEMQRAERKVSCPSIHTHLHFSN